MDSNPWTQTTKPPNPWNAPNLLAVEVLEDFWKMHHLDVGSFQQSFQQKKHLTWTMKMQILVSYFFQGYS